MWLTGVVVSQAMYGGQSGLESEAVGLELGSQHSIRGNPIPLIVTGLCRHDLGWVHSRQQFTMRILSTRVCGLACTVEHRHLHITHVSLTSSACVATSSWLLALRAGMGGVMLPFCLSMKLDADDGDMNSGQAKHQAAGVQTMQKRQSMILTSTVSVC